MSSSIDVFTIAAGCGTIVVGGLTWLLLGPNRDITRYGTWKKTDGAAVREGAITKLNGGTRKDIMFPSAKGDQCHAWLYQPPDAKHPPVIVMAGGFGAQKDLGVMEQYALKFQASGLAVFLFDYRGFGYSDGAVRNLIDPEGHVEDFKSALKYVRSNLSKEVNTHKIGLFGTSFSGGHILVVSSEEGNNLQAVVSLVPHLDQSAAKSRLFKPPPIGRGLIGGLRFLRTVWQDRTREVLGLPPAYVRITGTGEDGVALIQIPPFIFDKYFTKFPPSEKLLGHWMNLAPARSVNYCGDYSPINYVSKVTAPVMFVAAEKDVICPPEFIRKAQKMCSGETEMMVRDCGHMDLYFDEDHLAGCAEATSDFFHRKFK
mmetsp:Transcript_36928/g.44674  ORF Transcript_36928/g.44674 Transcript_36928/m.44674 type:complete len:372 (-) Transcript_36928:421-1536(-)|eukprot:CAMPEP_0197853086 /NCGR_PEP_ID=MMETSP1438-20131217/22046_1 /TAXON_ID=1461541 /ORGANISM="Pterosperma sp., Strain CCMP1384" /LENGTH=371 /DNA_ID=CAMNT_0043467371 /DNA_START=101 /DNA_END=1216 /DNA_ORIENTATION=+